MRDALYYEFDKGQVSSRDPVKCVFHEFGKNFYEFETGGCEFSTAIIELKEGELKNVPVDQIKFMDGFGDKSKDTIKLDKIREQTRKRVARYKKKRIGAGGVPIRDNNICSYCGGEYTGFDHIIPVSKGGPDTENNLVTCCIKCNKEKNNIDLVIFLNRSERVVIETVLENKILSKMVHFDGKLFKYSKGFTVNGNGNA